MNETLEKKVRILEDAIFNCENNLEMMRILLEDIRSLLDTDSFDQPKNSPNAKSASIPQLSNTTEPKKNLPDLNNFDDFDDNFDDFDDDYFNDLPPLPKSKDSSNRGVKTGRFDGRKIIFEDNSEQTPSTTDIKSLKLIRGDQVKVDDGLVSVVRQVSRVINSGKVTQVVPKVLMQLSGNEVEVVGGANLWVGDFINVVIPRNEESDVVTFDSFNDENEIEVVAKPNLNYKNMQSRLKRGLTSSPINVTINPQKSVSEADVDELR